MKSIKEGKIALDRSMKYFRGRTRYITSFEDIRLEDLFPVGYSDEDIINEYDEHYRENIDVWNIEIIVQTRS
jgi:hypothetical protein